MVQLHLTRETSPSLPHRRPSIPDTAAPADSANNIVKDSILPRQEGKWGQSLNSRSWTSGVMIPISSLVCVLFVFKLIKGTMAMLWGANEAPKQPG